ncbi:MAG: ABC transporter ATP-binding protein, partial [Chloroflexi bacterium]|nr:ABC transporter ATP-binding protein [Chloroflexota bacterium]
MGEPVISVQNLTRRFGDFVAVDHVSFEVEQGEIVGYLGPLENLTFYGGVYGIIDKNRIKQTLELVGLTGHESTLTRSLSAG